MLYKRRSIRLKNYDYSREGYYFVTICPQDRKCLFGDIVNGEMKINEMGKILNQAIQQTPIIRDNVKIDVFQIMPNHVHIILIITYCGRGVMHYAPTAQLKSPSQTLGSIIRGIKSITSKQIRIMMNNREFPVWQRNFYERIIHSEKELNQIRFYIQMNPSRWERDRNNADYVSQSKK